MFALTDLLTASFRFKLGFRVAGKHPVKVRLRITGKHPENFFSSPCESQCDISKVALTDIHNEDMMDWLFKNFRLLQFHCAIS